LDGDQALALPLLLIMLLLMVWMVITTLALP
jgi:hypothetical protein